MKKTFSIILSLLIVLSTVSLLSVSTFADNNVHTSLDGIWKYQLLDDDTVSIYSGNMYESAYLGLETNLIIPKTIDNYSVISIGQYAFGNCDCIQTITIQDNIKLIGDYAFYGCDLLEKVTIPDSVIAIGDYAFYGCVSLLNVIIPDSVQTIGGYCFTDCSSIKSVTIGENVSEIGLFAFSSCSSLLSASFNSNKLEIIKDGSFSDCVSLLSIEIPKSVTKIGMYAFENCLNLRMVNGGESVERIGDSAFLDCKSLEYFYVSSCVSRIGTKAFYGCISLKTIMFPNQKISFGNKSFGYWRDKATGIELKIDGFTIFGYRNTPVETYAIDNDLSFVAINSFPDVKVTDWFYEAVYYNSTRGFITGFKDGTFGPNKQLTRQDFVVILARIAGADLTPYENVQSTMPDVIKGSYYAAAVNWAVSEGIIGGYTSGANKGKFGVGDPITREQVCVILYRYMGSPSVTGADATLKPFADAGKISGFAKDAVVWAVQNGVISGKKPDTLAPTVTASRAEIATIVMRMDKAGMFNE